MKAVILNWRLGENDPFSVVNATICSHFRACGKNVELIEITDADWPRQLAALAGAGGSLHTLGKGWARPLRSANTAKACGTLSRFR